MNVYNGQGSGQLWLDQVMVCGPAAASYTAGHYGRTKSIVHVRKAASASSAQYGEVNSGTKLLIEGTETGTAIDGSTLWVKVRYGTAAGGNATAYIHSNYIEDIGVASDTAKQRCIDIATSLPVISEGVLGLGGDCCQQFIYWLCGACGLAVNNMPYGEDHCGPARAYFEVDGQGEWHLRSAGYVPRKGDLVYYMGDTDDTNSHVGLVTDVGANVYGSTGYTSIECNLSNSVKKVYGDYVSGQCRNDGSTADSGRIVQGFAEPLWS